MNQHKIAAPDLKPNYRLEVPTHLQYVLVTGLGSGVVGLILIVLVPGNLRLFATILLMIGIITLVPATILMLVTNNRARLSARRKMMETVVWRGDEMVLDVGCGNGFLLLEAAKHLTTGKAIGIDVWQDGAGGQSADAVWRNARIEAITDKIDLQNVDARTMPFERETFDVIVSSLALHHMGSNANREQALQEMIRVLKPGGMILLYDMFPIIGQAAAMMRQHGLKQVKRIDGLALTVLSANK